MDSSADFSHPPLAASPVAPLLDIDWDHLHQLSDNDTDFERELLSLFVADTQGQLLLLQEAIAHQRFTDIRTLAHYIKGASANVGVQSIRHCADRLEHSATESDLAPIVYNCNAIGVALQQLQQLMGDRLPCQPGSSPP